MDIFLATIAQNDLVGVQAVLTNQGDTNDDQTPVQDLTEPSKLLQVPLVAGTVNRRSRVVSVWSVWWPLRA